MWELEGQRHPRPRRADSTRSAQHPFGSCGCPREKLIDATEHVHVVRARALREQPHVGENVQACVALTRSPILVAHGLAVGLVTHREIHPMTDHTPSRSIPVTGDRDTSSRGEHHQQVSHSVERKLLRLRYETRPVAGYNASVSTTYWRIPRRDRREGARAARRPLVVAALERVPARLSSLGFDPWGFLAEGGDALVLGRGLALPPLVPRRDAGNRARPEGRVLLIANHGGQVPWDAMMLTVALLLDRAPPRLARGMFERFIANAPFICPMRRGSATSSETPTTAGGSSRRASRSWSSPRACEGSRRASSSATSSATSGAASSVSPSRPRRPIVPWGSSARRRPVPGSGTRSRSPGSSASPRCR